MGSRSDARVDVEPLTERQREVLALIARGYTNPQIADALGVTIDGAKWHVREIMSKLGVDSREAAAEWWRRERSMSSRVRRAVRGLAAAPWGRVVAWGSVGVGGVVVAVTIVAGALSGDGPDGAVVDVTATTAEPSTTPDADIFDGVRARKLVEGPDVELPAGLVVYYRIRIEDAGITPGMWRTYRDHAGTLWNENLTVELEQLGSLVSWSIDVATGAATATVCTAGECSDGRSHQAPMRNTEHSSRLMEA